MCVLTDKEISDIWNDFRLDHNEALRAVANAAVAADRASKDKLETVMPDGTTWQTYALSYESDGKTYCFNIMAYSAYHAALMLEDLKKTAVLDGKVIEVIDNA